MEHPHGGFPSPPDTGGPGSLVSRILQVALGLFVTTLELPQLPPEMAVNVSYGYECSFNQACRWTSAGSTADRWRLARGEPDSLLWLAATGTMVLPSEPFTLIEVRGRPSDMLASDLIHCQKDSALFSFTYWTVGNADLEICLMDKQMRQFNCTGMLHSHIQPGKVALKIPPIQHPFHIAIIPDSTTGIIVVDDIKYDAEYCGEMFLSTVPIFTTQPTITLLPEVALPWTLPPITPFPPVTTPSPPPVFATPVARTTELPVFPPRSPRPVFPTTTTEPPFDLLIIGNKTKPLFDRRRGKIIDDVSDLLCDFAFDYPCFWGPEAGKWAVIQKGAIPSLEESLASHAALPAFPAAVVIQGNAMLTSDPVRCQSGEGKLLFRYWTNGEVMLQACALGYNLDSEKVQCVDQLVKATAVDESTLAVFELASPIPEPFTLNIVPVWSSDSRNRYLIIDEIAYIGECNSTTLEELEGGGGSEYALKPFEPPTTSRPVTTTLRMLPTRRYTSTRRPVSSTRRTVTRKTTTTTRRTTTSPVYTTTSTYPPVWRTTSTSPSPPVPSVTVFPGIWLPKTTVKNSFTIPYTTTPRFLTTTTEGMLDYCKLLNCDFNDNACHYLNHGLTKVPWTLRNKAYGFPMSRHTDLRPTATNGQFVSTILGPGDFAILESPRFNLTQGINVLLFQYYRPTHASTIRLCLGTRYTKPLRTVSAFLQCPPILRSLTSKNAYKWNSVHIQLPPGTSHFYLVAHNLDRSSEKAAIAIDNIRVAICDPRTHDPGTSVEAYENF